MDDDLYARLAATGRPECPQCGYSLEGLPGPHRCPECGRPYGRDILTWRPAFPAWWTGLIVVGAPFLAFVVFDVWNSGVRAFIFIGLVAILAGWAHGIRVESRRRARDHVSIDDCRICYCSGGGELREFDWTAVRAVTHRRLWTRIQIEFHDGGELRFPRDLAPKDVVAFVKAANDYALAASGGGFDSVSGDDG